jgi:hypothetical protein
MEFLYRTATPAYRGCSSQPTQRTGLLSGLTCYLFGGGTAPTYRTKDGKNGAAAPTAPRCWWQAFPSTPPYKAAPSVGLDTAPDDGAACECPEDEVTSEDVPSVVHVWTE